MTRVSRCVLILVLCLTAGLAWSQTTEFQAPLVADANLCTGYNGNSTASSTNFGGSSSELFQRKLQFGFDQINEETGGSLIWGYLYPLGHCRMLMKFDLSGFPPNSVIESAGLFLRRQGKLGGYTPFNLTVSSVTEPWNELTVNQAVPPASILEDSETYPTAAFDKAYFDLTPLVLGWLDGSIPNYGIVLEREDPSEEAQFYFTSHEDADLRTPYLSIQYITSSTSPLISITQPTSEVLTDQGSLIPIAWNGTDDDDEATVVIGYDADGAPGSGDEHVIASGQAEDGSIVWDTSSVPPGFYWIYGTITGGGQTSTTYSPFSITLTAPSISFRLGRTTNLSGTPNSGTPGDEQGTFVAGDSARLTFLAINQGSVTRPVQVNVEIARHDDHATILFSSVNSFDSPLDGYEVDYYSFDWPIPGGTPVGQYDIRATLTGPGGSPVYETVDWLRALSVVNPPDGTSHTYALLIGSGAWDSARDPERELRAANDVFNLRNALLSFGSMWDAARIISLTNEQVSKSSIEGALNTLGLAMDADDLLLLSYAGNGADYGVDLFSGEVWATDEVQSALNLYLPALSKVALIVDAAYSGLFVDEAFAFPRANTFVLSSRRADQDLAWDGFYVAAAEASLFNHHLVAGLDGSADANSDGAVTSEEIYDYVVTWVSDGSVGLSEPQQDTAEGLDPIVLIQPLGPPATIPTITLSAPAVDATVSAGQTVAISWTDADSDHNATIALAFDPDTFSQPWALGEHTWIDGATALKEDPDGAGDTFTWDTTGVPLGTYVIWGMIDDGVHAPRFSKALGMVTVVQPVPGKFNKSNPVDGATDQSSTLVTLSWTTSLNADSYEYCLDTVDNDTCDTGWVPVGQNKTAPASGLSTSTAYFWQVRGVNGAGATEANDGAWWTFSTTVPPLGNFGKASPSNWSTGMPTEVTVSWNESANATSYEYCLDTVNNNACDVDWTSTGLERTVTFSGLSFGTTYYWAVRSRNLGGTKMADAGAYWRFTIYTPPRVTVSVTDSSASEQGPNPGQFTFRRTGSTTDPLTVNISVGGSAVPGSDYQALPAQVTIPARATSTNVVVTPIDDTEAEDPETIELTLLEGPGYTVGTTKPVKVNLADNDSGTGTTDLVVSALTGDSRLGPGFAFTTTDTTRNQGIGQTATTVTNFYLSTNTSWDAGDLYLGSRPVPALNANATSAVPTTLTIPPGTTSGRYYLIAKADANRQEYESTETNNTKYLTVYVGIDFTISYFSSKTSVAAGASFDATVETKNGGGGAAEASVTKFFLSANYSWDATDVPIGEVSVPALAPGAVYRTTLAITIPPTANKGAQYLIAVADADKLLAETQETNNSKTRTITIW